MQVSIALFSSFLLLMEVNLVLASCGQYYYFSLDVGTVECVNADRYTRNQWATCLSDTYIQQVSKGRHQCADRSVTYCYYQCQLEIYDEENGNVNNDCACQSSGETHPHLPVLLDLSCYSPSGTDCTWYSVCLEKRFPCQGGEDGYAIEYAEHFCNAFLQHQDQLSQVGQRWMDAVRRCLQVALAPSLRPFETMTCSSLKFRAFDSHPECYLNPYPGAPTICDLPIGDWWNVFWTIKGTLVTETKASVYGMYRVLLGCTRRVGSFFLQLGESTSTGTANLRVELSHSADVIQSLPGPPEPEVENVAGLQHERRRRQTGNDSAVMTDLQLRYLTLAEQVGEGVAAKLGWAQKGLVWFAYAEPSSNTTSLTANILLADQREYGLMPGSDGSSQPPINLTSVVEEAAIAFQSGKLNGIQLGGKPVQLAKFSACDDVDCQQVSLNVTAPPNPTGSSNRAEPALKILLCLLWMAFVM